MIREMQNPGGQAGASRNQLGGWLHSFPTVTDARAQMLTSRFCLSPWLAQDLAFLCFGEAGHE